MFSQDLKELASANSSVVLVKLGRFRSLPVAYNMPSQPSKLIITASWPLAGHARTTSFR